MISAISLWAMATSCTSENTEGKVEITFDYVKKQGPGSNQYAVWIENEKNEVVKTLFVTSFTTKGRIRDGELFPTVVPARFVRREVGDHRSEGRTQRTHIGGN